MKTLRIGIVGGGRMGRVHYANWKAVEGAEVAALCGNEGTAQQWGIPAFGSIEEMVRCAGVDVVDICTPTFLHHDQVMESLSLGTNVICEKPIALNLADAREMLDAGGKNGCHLYIAQVMQFSREIRTLHRLVETGVYGNVLDAFFERLSACPRWAADGWFFQKEKSGLLAYDLHIHDLDVLVSLFGKPKDFTVNSARGRGRDYPEHLRINYDYGTFHAVAEAAWFHADIPWTARWRVCFEDAVVICDEKGMIAYQMDRPPSVFDIKDTVEISDGINGWYYNELEHFARCIREGKETPLVSREQLLTVMETLEEISRRM